MNRVHQNKVAILKPKVMQSTLLEFKRQKSQSWLATKGRSAMTLNECFKKCAYLLINIPLFN